MHDIKAIREHPEEFDRGLKLRGLDPMAHALLVLDEQRRGAITRLETAQARRNAASKEIGEAKKAKDETRSQALLAEVAELKTAIAELEAQAKMASEKLDAALAEIPNLPLDEVPNGKDADDNVEHHRFGAVKNYAFAPKQHFELGETLGQMDFETAAKLSGARFVVLKNGLARLERALGQFMLDLHTGEHGYTEVAPPLLVRDDVMYGTAQLPKFADDQFPTRILREKPNPAPVVASFETFLLSTLELNSFWQEYSVDLSDYFENTKEQFHVGVEVKRAMAWVRYVVAQKVLESPLRDYFQKRSLRDDFKAPPEERSRVREEIIKTMQLARNAVVHSQKTSEVSFRDYFQKILSPDIFETLWLIPTAEVPLTNLVREQILNEDALPLRFTALTPCFRAEAGAAGKDTRGMLRQHQFDKVELVSITTPEESRDEHERMLSCAEEVLRRLDLHYRVVTLCTGDMGFASQKTYDIEVWLPGQGAYREISSCSQCGDFQARRMDARYRAADRAVRHVHTLNGSGVAVGRALIAVMETYQDEGGAIAVPEALRSYMGGVTRIERAAKSR